MKTKTPLKTLFAVFLLSATLQLHAESPTSFEEVKAKAEAGDIGAKTTSP